jgi:hypothetical protein
MLHVPATMNDDAENETTQEKGGVGRDAYPGLAGELGGELWEVGRRGDAVTRRGILQGRADDASTTESGTYRKMPTTEETASLTGMNGGRA